MRVLLFIKRLLLSFFFHDNGKFSWTAATSGYGLYMAHRIVTFVQSTIEAGGELPVEYLQWTVPIATALIAGRPVQMGLAAVRRPAVDGSDDKVDPFEEKEEKGYPVTDNGTPNFGYHEFESKDGAKMPADVRSNVLLLMQQMEVIREACGNRPIIIASGYRSPEHNKTIARAATDSQHLYGKACDFIVSGLPESKAQKIIKKLMDKGHIMQGGLAYERGMIHYDIRGSYATWTY